MRNPGTSVIGSIGIALLLAGPAGASPGGPAEVPPALRPPADQVLSLEASATGVQIYECSASASDPARFAWVFKAPEAELFDGSGRKIGRHYAGPTWESNDGSSVVGEVKARDDGPDPNAIPWLLLAAKSTSDAGAFGKVKSIQRLQTSGGKAPAASCGKENAREVARVPYKAVYTFWVARP